MCSVLRSTHVSEGHGPYTQIPLDVSETGPLAHPVMTLEILGKESHT